MVAVTGFAGADRQLGERLLMRRRPEQLHVARVAGAADVGDGLHPRRRGAVRTVTAVACRRREIIGDGQHAVVNRLFVVGDLVGGDLVRRHALRIGVTRCAGVDHARRVDGRARVMHGQDPMRTMTGDTGGGIGISGLDPLPVHAGPVLRQLIGGQIGRELLDERRVLVATATELRDLERGGLAAKPLVGIHRFHRVLSFGIAAVTRRTSEPRLVVHIVLEGFGNRLELVRQQEMTLYASALGRLVRRARRSRHQGYERHQHHRCSKPVRSSRSHFGNPPARERSVIPKM